MTIQQTITSAPGPEADLNDLSEGRRDRIAALRALGVDPYPPEAFAPSHSLHQAVAMASELIETEAELRLAGRIIGRRVIGKAVFLDLFDEADRLQIYLTPGVVDPTTWQILDLLDLGDFIGVTGPMFRTRRGEKTLEVRTLTVLGKGVLPIPLGKRDGSGVVHQALSDTGQRLRERHVSLLVDPVLRNRILLRDRLMREVRAYFQEEGFVELETPVLSRTYGGAAAKPFVAHSNALGADLYLRVSPECNLKRALCGGLPRVFEIGKNFRNEGIDASHNPEFTMIEWYEAWSDYRTQMVRFETLVARLAEVATNSTVVHFRGQAVDFAPPWPRLRVTDLVADEVGVLLRDLTCEAMDAYWERRELPEPRPTSWGGLVMGIFEESIEKSLKGPVFITDHPVEGSPLTKRHRDDPKLVERFEPFVLGMEIGNAYSELNDPDEQRRRLVEQDLSRDDPYGIDEQFLRALEHGMPQAGGAGLGLERIFMILSDASRLSDVILFPAV
eukprot:gene13774-13557_t